MKNYNRIIIFCAIVTVNLSCKKYLEEKSDDKLVVPTTLQDFQYLLDNAADMNNTTASYGCSSADDYFLTDVNYNNKSVFFQHVYKRIPFPYRYQNDWSLSYKVIYNCNLILERLALLDRTAANAAEYDNIRGSALFFRAYYNLELAWLFSKAYDAASADEDLGIPLRKNTNFFETSVRSSVRETYAEILNDARNAITLLRPMPLYTTRASKEAAGGLLARAFLSMRMYDSAYKYAAAALDIKSGLLNYNDASQVALNATNPFKLFNQEVVFHATMGTWITTYHPSTGPGRIDTLLYSDFHINDLRRRAFFTAVAPYQRFKGSYSGSASRLFSGIAVDELLLIAAECNARLNNKDAALLNLNKLLEKRFAPSNFIPVTAATPADALEIILKERRKELMFRGSLRWMDIKRLNKEGRNIELKRKIANDIFLLPPNDNRYALPLPEDVIELSGMQQN